MALSNLFREPRREVTETVVGAVVFVIPAYLDYRFAIWLQSITGGPNGTCPWPIGLFLGVLLAALSFGLILLIHGLGNLVCDSLQSHGIHLRPRTRRRN